MTTPRTEELRRRKPLRLWPGVVAVALQWVARFVLPVLAPGTVMYAVVGALLGGVAVVVWWLFFSRAPWSERVAAVLVMIAALFLMRPLTHVSIATGAQGMLFAILAIPVLSLAFVAWAVVSRNLADFPRRVSMVVTILAACGGWALVRTGGFSGNFDNDLMWRWAKTPEERLLAQSAGKTTPTPVPVPASASTVPLATPKETKEQLAGREDRKRAPLLPAATPVETGPEWRGFRGNDRNSIVSGVRIETDWSAAPPLRLWRKPIGPGWSSFAVRGNLLYTQEQRGSDEIVSCYSLLSGEPVWIHSDTARFWESNAGPGPRSTPTLANDRVYTLGATGILNALDARTGAVAWSRNAALDTGSKTPMWGFAGSPLIFEDAVIVAVSGRLAAYDLATGARRWLGPRGRVSYSSPQLWRANGVTQVLLLNGAGVVAVAPRNGKVLWEHGWPGNPIVQPAVIEAGDILMSVSEQSGLRRISVAPTSDGWQVLERWTSMGLKPYFNDFVVHKGHAFGFDGSILACIELETGKRKWKGGRYGFGQMFLVPDQDLLLLLSEEGELVLVKAAPDGYTEVARVPAIEGKTWNHPVLVGDVLLARNAEEMAAFRLTVARQ